jgi:hypothetical protein
MWSSTGAAGRQGPGVPEARSPGRRNDPTSRPSCTPTSARAAAASMKGAARLPQQMIEMHISEIGFCSGHSASGVWVNATRRDHGARAVCRRRHGQRAAQLHAGRLHLRLVRRRERRDLRGASTVGCGRPRTDRGGACAHSRAAGRGPTGMTPTRLEYKLRRMVQRLPAAAEGHAQDAKSALSASAKSARTSRSLSAANGSARTDACDGGASHLRLRGNGGARLDVPHRKPLGSLPLPRGLSRA